MAPSSRNLLVAKAAAHLHVDECVVKPLVEKQGLVTLRAVTQSYFHARRQALAQTPPRDATEWLQGLQELLEHKPVNADVDAEIAQEIALTLDAAYRLPLEDVPLTSARSMFDSALNWSMGSADHVRRIHRAATALMIRLVLINTADASMASTIGTEAVCYPLVAVLRVLWAAKAFASADDAAAALNESRGADMSLSNIAADALPVDSDDAKRVFLANYEAAFRALESLYVRAKDDVTPNERKALRGMMANVIEAFPLASDDADADDDLHFVVVALCFAGFENDADACTAFWNGAYKSLRSLLLADNMSLAHRVAFLANVASGPVASKAVLDVLARQGTPLSDLVRAPSALVVPVAKLMATLDDVPAGVAKHFAATLAVELSTRKDDADASSMASALTSLCRLHPAVVLPLFQAAGASTRRHGFNSTLLAVVHARCCHDKSALRLVLQLALSADAVAASALHADLFAFALSPAHFALDSALALQVLGHLPSMAHSGWFDFSPVVRALDQPDLALDAVHALERIACLSPKHDWALSLAGSQSAVLAVARLMPVRGAELLQRLMLALRAAQGPSLLGVLDSAMNVVLVWLTEALGAGDTSVVSLLACAARVEPGFCARCMPDAAPFVVQMLNPALGVAAQDARLYERAMCLCLQLARAGQSVLGAEEMQWLDCSTQALDGVDAVGLAAKAHALNLVALATSSSTAPRSQQLTALRGLPAVPPPPPPRGLKPPDALEMYKRQFAAEEEELGPAFAYHVDLVAAYCPPALLQQACALGEDESTRRACAMLVDAWGALAARQPRDAAAVALVAPTCDTLERAAQSSPLLLKSLAKSIFALAGKAGKAASGLGGVAASGDDVGKVLPRLFGALAAALKWEGEDEAVESICAAVLALNGGQAAAAVPPAVASALALEGLVHRSSSLRSADALLLVLSTMIEAAPEAILDALGRVWNSLWVMEGPKRARLIDAKRLERTLVVLGRAARFDRPRRYLMHLDVVARLAAMSLSDACWKAALVVVTALAADAPAETEQFCRANLSRITAALKVLDGGAFALADVRLATRLVVLLGRTHDFAGLRGDVARVLSMAVDGEDASRTMGLLEEFADLAACVSEALPHNGPPPRLVLRATPATDEDKRNNATPAYQPRAAVDPHRSPRPLTKSPSNTSTNVLPPAAGSVTQFHVAVERAVAQLALAALLSAPRPFGVSTSSSTRDAPDAQTLHSLLLWCRLALKRAVHVGEPDALAGLVAGAAVMRLVECLERMDATFASWRASSQGKKLVKKLQGKSGLVHAVAGYVAAGSGLDAAVVDEGARCIEDLLAAPPPTSSHALAGAVPSPIAAAAAAPTAALVWLSTEPASVGLWLDAMQAEFANRVIAVRARDVDQGCAERFTRAFPDWQARVTALERRSLEGDALATFELCAASSSSTRVPADELAGLVTAVRAEAARAGGAQRVCLGGTGVGGALAILVAAQCAAEGLALGALFAVNPGPVPNAEALAHMPRDSAWPLRVFIVRPRGEAQSAALLAGMRAAGYQHVHAADGVGFDLDTAALLEGVIKQL